MKALKPMFLKLSGISYRIKSGIEVPQKVVDFWKSKNQLSEFIKNGSISDDTQKITTAINVNDKADNGQKK